MQARLNPASIHRPSRPEQKASYSSASTLSIYRVQLEGGITTAITWLAGIYVIHTHLILNCAHGFTITTRSYFSSGI